ncbi:GTP-binding protein [Nakamurella sp.]|uniref:GTP-binding protein n=1 Tax=Nakamurella sp. TaxID=1869182 RepID=UPI003B3AA5D8
MIPLVVLATVDPVLRDAAVFSLLTDLPGTGFVRQDMDPLTRTVRRVAGDADGLVDDVTEPAAHGCPGCVQRENLRPAMEAMVGRARWARIVLALPVAAATAPAGRPRAAPALRRRLGVDLATVVCLVDVDRVEHDLMGGDLLADRGLGLTAGDGRAVGEVLAAQLAHADVVLTTGSSPAGLTLVNHLRGRRSSRRDLFAADARELFTARHSAGHAAARIDPYWLSRSTTPDAHGVWTLDLVSERPVHPQRFLDRLPDLAGGRVRTRGRFRVPTRPDRLGVLDGTGGHLSIGDAGRPAAPLATRMVITGIGAHTGDRRRAFTDILLTDREMESDRDWSTVDDGLDDWLGGR